MPLFLHLFFLFTINKFIHHSSFINKQPLNPISLEMEMYVNIGHKRYSSGNLWGGGWGAVGKAAGYTLPWILLYISYLSGYLYIKSVGNRGEGGG